MSDPLNEILLDLTDYAWANGSFGPSELRQHAEYVAKKVGEARLEREMFIYWILKSYRTLGREGWEEGRTDDQTREDLLHVLANAGYEPNENPKADELAARPPAYFLERAKELWRTAAGEDKE